MCLLSEVINVFCKYGRIINVLNCDNMNLRKCLGLITIVAVVGAAVWNYQQSRKHVVLSDLALANIEALATGEVEIQCDSYSVVILCQKTCPNCGRVWKAINGYGNPGNLRGTCICGRTF